ncbi:hypothetical protein B0T11DRAFT_299358 [Plectosphaerella cucumerina]|uniref:Uncharacterized protein n=1 Tax=Plectosphaerella cucumerina TaxID=40658 RepID=A0A8K0TDR0_9PEZI|nr:hypothetical protein B0T11DRAFT_299358 [Plectosphaerella cucumerina]
MPPPPKDSGMDAGSGPESKIPMDAIDYIKHQIDELFRFQEAKGRSRNHTEEFVLLVHGVKLALDMAYDSGSLPRPESARTLGIPLLEEEIDEDSSTMTAIWRDMRAMLIISKSEDQRQAIRQLRIDLSKAIEYPDSHYAPVRPKNLYFPVTPVPFETEFEHYMRRQAEIRQSLADASGQHPRDVGDAEVQKVPQKEKMEKWARDAEEAAKQAEDEAKDQDQKPKWTFGGQPYDAI